MKKRLMAVALTAATTIPLLPAAATPVAHAVSCQVTTVLMPGTTNAAVQCLEERLNELGYGVGTPDTYYGTASQNAVKYFQVSRGLYGDAVVTSVVSRQLGLRGGALPSGPTIGKVTFLGDSTSAAMRWTDEINNNSQRYDIIGNTYDLQWALESCRRLVNTSCLSRTNTFTQTKIVPVSVLPLMQGSLNGRLGQAIVIMAGYDDYSIANTIDPIMNEAKAQGVTHVFWLNYRLTSSYNSAYQGYYTQHNANLELAKSRWPNLTVLDWNTYTYSQSPATQDAWFNNDQIHMTAAGASALANFVKTALDAANVHSCAAGNANAGVPDPTTGAPTTPAAVDTAFVPNDPVRLFDTRTPGLGGGNGKVGAGRTVTIDLPSLPSGTQSVAVNVTAANPCRQGYLTVFDCNVRPDTSNVNYVAGRSTAGLAISLIDGGEVCVYSSQMTDLVVDLVGVFAPDGLLFHPIDPTRWVDTRGNPAVLPINGQLAPGAQIDVDIRGSGGIPESAEAVWVNLTGTGSPFNAVLQLYPGPCSTPPSTSTVNVLANRAGANAALVKVGTNGGVCVRAFSGIPHVVLDVAGWFDDNATGGMSYRAASPARPLDTRNGAPVGAGGVAPLTVGTVSVFNVATVNPAAVGFVSAEPCGSTAVSSLLNTAKGEPTANLGVIGPGTNSQVCFSPSVSTHLLADLVGTFLLAP